MKYSKIAFTLAEVMITLTVIGIITAVIMPVAIQSKPDENVMKFKKAHNTLYQVIQALVSSEKYYCNGDLGIKADCTTLINFNTNQNTDPYFCKTFADLVSVKNKNCYEGPYILGGAGSLGVSSDTDDETEEDEDSLTVAQITVTDETIQKAKSRYDRICKKNSPTMGNEIETTDGIVYLNAGSIPFGKAGSKIGGKRYFSPPGQFPATFADQNGMDVRYKIFCIDIDGIPADATSSKCKNECPFGYGIRADGKIMNGKRAEEWLAKDIQGE